LALIEGCKHSLDIVVPVDEVESETERVVADITKRAKLPGFRPGKAPAAHIRKVFAGQIRQQVIENLLPKALQRRVEDENLKVVGTPDIKNVKFTEGQPLEFTAEFEVAPEFELGEYVGVEVTYDDPQITDADIDARLAQIRERHADYSNVDPRPLADGDVAVISMRSVSGVDEPMQQEELLVEIGAEDTIADFTENLRGMSPGESKEFDVTYPQDFGRPQLAGKTVRFLATVKAIRKKELPELNDEFAKDIGDFQSLEELREEIRRNLYAERQYEAQEAARNAIVEKLVDAHDFAVPETYIERQVRSRVEQTLRGMAAEGVDISKLKPDWERVMAGQRERAIREVKASLILSKIAEREAIEPTMEEVDREVERIARQQREPVAALKLKYRKDGTLGRIASHLQTQKTLAFLFERARKIAAE